MSNAGDDRVRSAWAKQADQPFDVNSTNTEAAVRRRQADIARRDRRLYLSAIAIVPSWLAAIWFMPDLRLISAIGLFTGVWVTWQMYSHSAARLAGGFDLPCLVFQRALLERELDLARSLPKRILLPLAVVQLALAATLATNPRFTTSQLFPEGLFLFIATAGVALVVIWRRWQRQAVELQRELDAIGAVSSQ